MSRGQVFVRAGGPADTRHECPFCKVRTWLPDRAGFMRDHDRPDGRRCGRAARAQRDADHAERQALIAALGMAPEERDNPYAATTGELARWVAEKRAGGAS